MNIINRVILPVVVVAVFLLSTATFQVKQYQTALEFRLGEIVQEGFDPGLHFKIPFINSVRLFDKRVLTMTSQPERFLTSEKKNLIVDYYIKWRIVNPADFYRATRGEERIAMNRMDQIVRDSMKSQISSLTLNEVVSGDRDLFMRHVIDVTNKDIHGLGIEITDVRIMQIELPQEVRKSVYARMEKERFAVAQSIRSRGEEQAKKITADADRQREVILAEANRQAAKIRGEGDAQAAKTYAEAYTADPGFFDFYRSLEAYKKAFDQGDSTFVLNPDTPFFQYFRAPGQPGAAESGHGGSAAKH
ncbi:HflC protein [Halothiobacillus diazotrophicus]|uniref:Protein HflC n=1 Tax=Halothiobacillus diazotrophicus TaxID=1860122 RepID=A0A191ZJ20_9GAMM|nr:protease modulator HflC [Halothiobacillus diazotrophicus]ANJ67838.1 HflC protein [Halothiobacillus diazotrophicus]